MTIISETYYGIQINMYAELQADFRSALDCFYYCWGKKLWFYRVTQKMSMKDAKKLWKEAFYFQTEHKQPHMDVLKTIKLYDNKKRLLNE